MMRSNYSFKFPCSFELFNGKTKVADVEATSFVLDNNSIVLTINGSMDRGFSGISLTLKERVEKRLMEGRHDAYLLPVT